MPNAKFSLKEPQGTEETLVYLFFAYSYQRLKYSTGEKIKPKYWNIETQRAKETKLFPDYFEFNTRLNNIQEKINSAYRKFVNDGITPTPSHLKQALNEALGKQAKIQTNLFTSFMESIINSSNNKPNTIKNYNQTLRQLKDFEDQNKLTLKFEDINLAFYDSFERFCINQKLSKNTFGGYIKNVKVFMGIAFDKKLTTNIEYKNKRFKTVEEESESIYLSIDEIKTLYQYDLSKNPRLDKVRDMFIIACYTGLRYSDLIQLTNDHFNLKEATLKVKTEKTGETVIIPLHSFVKNILIKHDGVPEYKISNQKMNEFLKELCGLVKFDEDILIFSAKGKKKENNSFKKYELITTHTARRSFATNAFLKNIPSISIMKITGHKTEKSFLKYIKMSQTENAMKLRNHEFFK